MPLIGRDVYYDSSVSSRSSAPSSPSVLYSDEYVCVRITNSGLLIRVERTAAPHPDREALIASYRKVIAAVERGGRQGRALLIDTRVPTGRNDKWFEDAMSWVRPRLDAGFVRVGVLIRSAMGALQIRRLMSEDGIERSLGTNEEELVAVLIKDLPPRR